MDSSPIELCHFGSCTAVLYTVHSSDTVHTDKHSRFNFCQVEEVPILSPRWSPGNIRTGSDVIGLGEDAGGVRVSMGTRSKANI